MYLYEETIVVVKGGIGEFKREVEWQTVIVETPLALIQLG